MQRVNLILAINIVLVVAIISPPPSGLAGPGTQGSQILDLGGGTRATALGDAFTAVDGDVTSALWNPSGLGIIQEKQVAISYKNQGDIFGRRAKDCTMHSLPELCRLALPASLERRFSFKDKEPSW